jgi:hypothetical protein
VSGTVVVVVVVVVEVEEVRSGAGQAMCGWMRVERAREQAKHGMARQQSVSRIDERMCTGRDGSDAQESEQARRGMARQEGCARVRVRVKMGAPRKPWHGTSVMCKGSRRECHALLVQMNFHVAVELVRPSSSHVSCSLPSMCVICGVPPLPFMLPEEPTGTVEPSASGGEASVEPSASGGEAPDDGTSSSSTAWCTPRYERQSSTCANRTEMAAPLQRLSVGMGVSVRAREHVSASVSMSTECIRAQSSSAVPVPVCLCVCVRGPCA